MYNILYILYWVKHHKCLYVKYSDIYYDIYTHKPVCDIQLICFN